MSPPVTSDEDSTVEIQNISNSSGNRVKKHPFFMAPAERAAHRLTEQISASNALNRAIQINLLSEDETDLETAESTETNISKTFCSNLFFQKRTKMSSTGSKRHECKLKRISSIDPPPFPLEFQLIKPSLSYAKEVFDFEFRLNKGNFESQFINLKPESSSVKVPLAKLLRTEYSNMSIEDLKKLNSLTKFRSLHSLTLPRNSKNVMRTILNEIELAFNDNNPILWVISGPTGCGKTRLVEDLSDKLGLRLITIDSSQSPRNSKTFETLQTTLSHSTPGTLSKQFFTNVSSEESKMAILFDEVEIAFENDRGYWTALSAFLQNVSQRSNKLTKPSKSVPGPVPIFITSNASKSFLETIIKFPEHAQFIQFYSPHPFPDYRGFNNNSDVINRLHRIDTSIEYEQFVLNTGYYNSESNEISDIRSRSLISESLKWNGLIETIHIPKENASFNPCYLEASSLADVLLSIKDRSDALKLMDFFNFHDINDESDSLNESLYTSLPEIYENSNTESMRIARELIERTVYFNNPIEHPLQINQSEWIDLSKKLLTRFNDYTRNLQSLRIWQTELTDHVTLIEREYFAFYNSRMRRKRAYYRYLGEELFNEILKNQ